MMEQCIRRRHQNGFIARVTDTFSDVIVSRGRTLTARADSRMREDPQPIPVTGLGRIAGAGLEPATPAL
jgi:hypothetical protein